MHPGKELIERSQDGASLVGPDGFADRLAEDELKYDEGRNDPMKSDLKSSVTLMRLSGHGVQWLGKLCHGGVPRP